jgi:hypothetical protein
MPEAEVSRFTIGVFADAAWAGRGLDALKQRGFPAEALSVLAKETPDSVALVEGTFGGTAARLVLRRLGTVVATGGLVAALDGTAGDLARVGLAASLRRVGFQTHDGQIFEALTDKGGILVAVAGESKAADALAVLHSYGGGNAAIGAWTGRL